MVFSSGASDSSPHLPIDSGSHQIGQCSIGLRRAGVPLQHSSTFSPYFRGNLGLVFSNQTLIRMVGHFPTIEGQADLVVYDDDHESRVDPQFALGAGFTVAIAPGYQLRWEIRDTLPACRLSRPQPLRPVPFLPTRWRSKHLFSLSIGFDVVLERRKGRRY